MPWYHTIHPMSGKQIGNDHFVEVLRQHEDGYSWRATTLCLLDLTVPEVVTSSDPWQRATGRPRKCPICVNRREESRSSTASAPAASRSRPGKAMTSPRSARGVKGTAVPTRRRAVSSATKRKENA